MKGRRARFIPLVDKLEMVLKNGADLGGVAPLCGVYQLFELTYLIAPHSASSLH